MTPKRLATFMVSEELDQGLERLKERTGAAKGELIRRAIAEYLTKHGALDEQKAANRRARTRRKA